MRLTPVTFHKPAAATASQRFTGKPRKQADGPAREQDLTLLYPRILNADEMHAELRAQGWDDAEIADHMTTINYLAEQVALASSTPRGASLMERTLEALGIPVLGENERIH